jgi:hypothetical protein
MAYRINRLAGIDDRDMKRETLAGHHISSAEFSGLVEAVRESMRARDVPLAARNQLLEILAPMNRDVVNL